MQPLVGSSFPLALELKKDFPIEKGYGGLFWKSAAVSAITMPFRFAERLFTDGKVKRYQVEQDPVFILGHWRSGTTYLHNILSQDPQYGYVTTFQGVFPEVLLFGPNKFIFKNFMKAIMPKKRPGDNIELNADFPQEEEFALSNRTKVNYYYFFYFPQFMRELYHKYVAFDTVDNTVIEHWKSEYLRLVKKAMINTKGQRYISKNPPHTARIKQILEMFPNAKFIHICRNPITVLLSTRKFFTVISDQLRLQGITEDELVDNILYVYKELEGKYLAERSLIPEDNLLEIKYEEFVQTPIEHLRDIYSRLNLGDFGALEPTFQAYADKKKNYKKNVHKIRRSLVDKILKEWDFAIKEYGYGLPDNVEIID